MAVSRFYKIINPKGAPTAIPDNQGIDGSGLYGNYSWYGRLLQGSPSRRTRYQEYDVMDADIDISRALDIVAEEMTGNNSKTNLPLVLQITAGNEQRVPTRIVVTLQAALKTFINLQSLDTRLFSIIRNVLKYGDQFFDRTEKPNKKWQNVHIKQVVSAVVAKNDVTKIQGWRIAGDSKNSNANINVGGYYSLSSASESQGPGEVFDAERVVRFTLNDDMSEEAPFGESILRTIYKTFKQKELLEDAVLIYRIVRAPERRVFYVDVGKMPAHRIAQHLETMRNEIKQKKIPTMYGGKNQVESIYNPQSMSEDFFFAQREDGRGSRVETLPGGQGLGELTELQYFYLKLWRGLRIPASYMGNTTEDGAIANDGAVGIAYIQEIKFVKYVERLQRCIERTLDTEFKRFLHDMKINIDPTLFRVILPEPTNWSKSRQQKVDQESVNVYNGIKDDGAISKRFAQLNYLQLSKEQLLTNERMLREEKGVDPDGGIQDLPKLYFPEEAEAGGFEAGLGSVGGAGGDETGGDEGFEDGENVESEEGEEIPGEQGEEAPIGKTAASSGRK
jgi:hypothetical protein